MAGSFSLKQHEQWYKEQGWHFNSNNDFVDRNGNLFNFKLHESHYEYVHLMIKDHLHTMLMRKYKFLRYPVPFDQVQARRKRSEQSCPHIFVTRDAMLNPNLLVIVQGLGEVAPGQWARKLFTNGEKDQWNYATQLPYIERALHLGWAVLLCDINHGGGFIKSDKTRAHHVLRVWEDIIRRSNAECVMFVSFSAGTRATLDLFDAIRPEFMQRVQGVALLDGVTGKDYHRYKDGRWLKEHSWFFVSGDEGRKVGENGEVVLTHDHDKVPGTAVGKVFEYLKECQSWYTASLTTEELRRYRRNLRWRE
ncbi:hypothetical protein BGZ75_003078 [Mortierella antarctica]|nr:hypothetical protein BGZ67_000202 [Mortierella alpina]KAF9985349.1 hypothetical protein BGZ75_003078 [Mortierella antarctica]